MYDELITINCCGKKQHFANRSEAIQHFFNTMENCSDKTMYDIYASIFCRLMEGKEVID